MSGRLHVAGGTVVTPEGRFAADVVAEDGRIVAIQEPGRPTDADERLDARGLLVFPGFIDPHVHSRDPGITAKEDFAHATTAALAGGLTTIFEMPNAVPPVTTGAIFDQRVAEHEAVAAVDFGLWGQAIGDENLDDLADLVGRGAVGIKLFWGYALDRETKRLVYTAGDTDPADVIQPPDIGGVRRIVERIADAGGLFSAHCEEAGIIAAAEAALPNGIQTYDDLLAARPAVAEVVAVSAATEFARETGCRLHIVHVSARRTVELLRVAQAEGVDVTGEACAHYLVLDDRDVERVGTGMKVYPPIRTADDQRALWTGLADGTLSVLASDHAPHTPEDKALPLGAQPAGMQAIETLVPLILDRMTAGQLTPTQVAALLSANTARTFRVDHRKGAVAVGHDADLTLVDPEREWRIDQAKLHAKHRISVFDGFTGRGAAVASVIRGRVAMRDNEPVGDPAGRFVAARPKGSA